MEKKNLLMLYGAIAAVIVVIVLIIVFSGPKDPSIYDKEKTVVGSTPGNKRAVGPGCYQNNKNGNCTNGSVLNSGWSYQTQSKTVGPESNVWLQLDLGEEGTWVTGVALQKSGRFPWRYVKSFKVWAWCPKKKKWFWVEGGKTFKGFEIKDWKKDPKNRIVKAYFKKAVHARYIRIYPMTFQEYPDMRADVILKAPEK